MKRIRIKSENDQDYSNYKILHEKKTTLQYLEEYYEITIKYEEKENEYFISFLAKKEDTPENFTYEIRMKYEDFNTCINIDSILLNLYDTTEKIYFFIIDVINEKGKKNFLIKQADYLNLTLLITTKFLGFSEPLLMKINLKRKDYDLYDLVKMLCEKVSYLERENKLIKFKLDNKIVKDENELNFIKERLLQIPEYVDKKKKKKISLKLLYRLTENGSSVLNFRKLCNNIPNNLTLIKTTEDERFGGFTQRAWTSNGKNKYDNNAFCFSLSKMKIYNIIKNSEAIGDYNSAGPVFLDNMFYIGYYNGSLHDGNCSKNTKSNYSGERSPYEINNNKEYFTVQEFEFYEVLFI
eukprot:jgi/Orpsp1_1/1188029/evm.model.d7180000061969.1